MAAELTRGQNLPLPRTRWEIRVLAEVPLLVAATLGDERGLVPGAHAVAHAGAPALPGVEVPRQAAAGHRLVLDPDHLPEWAHRVTVLLALPDRPGAPGVFGAVAAPRAALTGSDGAEIARFTLTGLDAERAVVALEVYRRDDAWKVRAVGQGYAGGLADLLADQGLSEAVELAARIQRDAGAGLASARVPPQHAPDPRGPGGGIDCSHPRRRTSGGDTPAPSGADADDRYPQPVAGDAPGWSMQERLYHQVWGMFEDLARATAALRSAEDFADSRLERELDQALADPRARLGEAGTAAREAAHVRRAELAGQARAAFDRDLAQLTAESEVVEAALPPAYARWDNPVWHGYQVPAEPPHAVRLGDLHLPESEPLRIPLLLRLPLERGLWIDSSPSKDPAGGLDDSTESLPRLALDLAVTLAVRLLAAHPAGEFTVSVVDPADAGTQALLPLTRTGALVAPPAVGAAGVARTLDQLARRVDLVRMAVSGGAAGSLPAGLDTASQLLIVNDFPQAFDDRAVNQLRYLADEGPAVGVHLLLVADPADAEAYGPLLDPLWRSLMRLTPVPDRHLADPWVGHAWTYEPARVPAGSQILHQVLTEVSRARTKQQ